MIGGVQVVAVPKISQRFVVIMDTDSILEAVFKNRGSSGITSTFYRWSRGDVVPDNFDAGLKLGQFARCLLEQV